MAKKCFTLRCSPQLHSLLAMHSGQLEHILTSHHNTLQKQYQYAQHTNQVTQHQTVINNLTQQLTQQQAQYQTEITHLNQQITQQQQEIMHLTQQLTQQYTTTTNLIQQITHLKEENHELTGGVVLADLPDIRKESFISNLSTKLFNKRTTLSDRIMTDACEKLAKIHGHKVVAPALAKYFEDHHNEVFVEAIVNSYKQGQIKQNFVAKQTHNIQISLTAAQATEIIDTVPEINLTGFLAIMAHLRSILPPHSLPSEKDIKTVRKLWGEEMTEFLDLQPTGGGTCGWDIDPEKLLKLLLTDIYPKLCEDECRPKSCSKVRVYGERVLFLDKTVQLNIGDELELHNNKRRIQWVTRPTSVFSQPIYWLDGPIPGCPIDEIDCIVQQAIYFVRTDDGRDILSKGQVMESWRITNKSLNKQAQSPSDVWFTCLIDGAESKENIELGRKQQYDSIKRMKDKEYIEVYNKLYPIVIVGPADLKNLKVMHQCGGNSCTTDDFCTHCGRTRKERSIFPDHIASKKRNSYKLQSFRVGSGTRPNSISELDIIYSMVYFIVLSVCFCKNVFDCSDILLNALSALCMLMHE